MLAEFGTKKSNRCSYCRTRFAGISVGAAMNGNRPIVEFMTFNFLFGSDRSDYF